MLKKISVFFEKFILVEQNSIDPQHALNLAIAAMLIEMINIDSEISTEEQSRLQQILTSQYGIAASEIDELTRLATEELSDATDYYQFTSLINQHYERTQKVKILEHLWQIAIADGNLDKHEEHYLRKMADLLFIPHSDFIRTKLKVLEQHNLN